MDIKTIKALQEELSTLIGVSGYEDDVSNYILELIEKTSKPTRHRDQIC